MKNFLVLFCLVLCTFFFKQNETFSQWIHTGPEGGEMWGLCVHGSDLFASPWSGGIYRSTNNGSSWESVNNGLPYPRVTALVSVGTNIFAGTRQHGVYLSTDNGGSWVEANDGGTAGATVNTFANIGTTVFMAGNGDGIFRTTNNGVSWELVFQNLNIMYIGVYGDTLFAASWPNGGVYRSVDNGNNWIQIVTTQVEQAYGFAFIGNDIFLGTYAHGLYHSTDNGDSWTQVTGLPSNANIRGLTVSNSYIFAATRGQGIFVTTDLGANWNSVNTGLPDNRIERIIVHPNQDLYVGLYFNGIYRSSDNGTNWFEANSGFNAMHTYRYNKFPNGSGGYNLLAGTTAGIYRSTDDGTEWSYLGLSDRRINAIEVMDSIIFVGGLGATGGVLRSSDGGMTWSPSGLPGVNIQSFFTSSSGDLYAGTALFAGGYRSTDGGNTWSQIIGINYQWIFDFAENDQFLFVCSVGGGVSRSSDNGISFAPVNNGLDTKVASLAIMDTSIFAGIGSSNTLGATGVYRSDNNGDNWTQVNNGLPPDLNVWALTVIDNNLFAASSTTDPEGTPADVYLSTDRGESWSSVGTGFISNYFQTLFIDSTKIFLGTIGSSTWWRPLSEMIPETLPIAPTNLIAVADTFSVDLSWDDNSDNELGFKIERKDDSLHIPGPWTLVDSVGANVNTFTDTGLVPNTVYSYRVYAYNTAGNSASDSVETVTVVPVELTSFTAIVNGNGVNLSWSTATETNNKGFEVEKQISNPQSSVNKWESIAFIEGNGTTTLNHTYTFTDKNTLTGKYLYRLKQLDFNGSYMYSKGVEVEISQPKEFSLSQNYPNPFNPATTIEYTIPEDGFVMLKVYNALGQEVTRLVNGNAKAGIHHVTFDASNLTSGVYFYSVQSNNETIVKKMMVLK